MAWSRCSLCDTTFQVETLNDAIDAMDSHLEQAHAVTTFRLGRDICPTCRTTGTYDCPACGLWTHSVEDVD